MSKLHIITVATESKYYFPYLVESCKKNNNELIVLGFGEKWKGFSWRFKLMIQYLQNIPLEDIVCFVDGYDVICTRNLNELIECFYTISNKHKCKIIVGYENISNTIVKTLSRLRFTNVINAGTYISKCKDILDLLSNILNKDSNNLSDDQFLLNQYYNLNENNIYIDMNGCLFGTIASGLPFDDIDKYYILRNNNLYTKDTNTQPFFIHAFNNCNLSTILNKMNYNCDSTIINNLKKEYLSKCIRAVYFPIKKYKYKICFISIFIFIFLHFITNIRSNCS